MTKKFELGKLKIKIYVDEYNDIMIKIDSDGYGNRIELTKSQFTSIFKHFDVLLNEMIKMESQLTKINQLEEINDDKNEEE